MSNVLIGIIGIILFIGLALAGALFLGPKFQSARSNGKASQAVQAVQQVAHAVDLQYTNTSVRRAANQPLGDLVSLGYIKSIPVGPGPASNQVFLSDETFSNSGLAAFSVVALGSSDDAKNTCQAVESLYHFKMDGSIPNETDPNIGAAQAGCLFDNIYGLGYVIYARV